MEDLNIAKKIQTIRLKCGLSVRKTAELAGITPSMLSQIENAQANPSINTLRAIANVLGTPLYTFFMEESSASPVVHPSERKTIGSKDHPEVRYELLTRDTQGSIEFCMMVIPAGVNTYPRAQSHEGEETAYMLQGQEVLLEMDGNLLPLAPGDSVRIPPGTPHVWHNRTDAPVKVIFAVSPPSF